jgi:hypothetical protein
LRFSRLHSSSIRSGIPLRQAFACTLIALSAQQKDEWAQVNSSLGRSLPNSNLRLALSVLLLLNSLVGLVVGATQHKLGVTCFGVTALALTVLNLISCAMDGFLLADGESRCQNACVAMGLPSVITGSCKCSFGWPLKNTLIINFVCIVLSVRRLLPRSHCPLGPGLCYFVRLFSLCLFAL